MSRSSQERHGLPGYPSSISSTLKKLWSILAQRFDARKQREFPVFLQALDALSLLETEEVSLVR